MSKIIVTRGLPASGKSTWAKAWVAADPANRVRVNRDDLRFMMFGAYWGPTVDETAISAAEHALVKGALAKGKDVVIDATHLKAGYITKWYQLGAPVEVQDFTQPLHVLVRRDEERRIAGNRAVGGQVIRDLAKRFHIPADGTLPKLPARPATDAERFKPYVPGKIKAYSFDIDGTLLQMNGKRGPYDTHLYHVDDADPQVVQVLWDLQDWAQYRGGRTGEDTSFIGLSGRNEDFRAETIASLESWGIYLDQLFMRPSDNPQGNDADVKSDLVDKHISGVYDVIMHFDDRNRVVDALRAKGMKVAQVQPGDF